MIKFSLIMAAYNAERYIQAAIDSVIRQTYGNWELIIIDDGSTDRTPEIADEYQKADSRIITIHQSNSGTASAARNAALQYVTGSYVQMVDADDLIREDLLSAYAGKLQESDYDIVIPNCISFENDDLSAVVWKKTAPGGDYTQVLNGEQAFFLSLDWTIHGIFLMQSRLIQSIRYDPELINGDEFTTRKLLYNAKKTSFADSYYYYRRNTASTTKSSKNRIRMFETLLTDMHIYQYARENNMSGTVVSKCGNMMVFSICDYAKKYFGLNREEGASKAEEILSGTFDAIPAEIWEQAPVKYRLLYRLSGGKFSRMMKMMQIISGIDKLGSMGR